MRDTHEQTSQKVNVNKLYVKLAKCPMAETPWHCHEYRKYRLKLHANFADRLWSFKSMSQTATKHSAIGLSIYKQNYVYLFDFYAHSLYSCTSEL